MEDQAQKINILIVDDNPNNLLSLETILQMPDRNLVRASSGEEALRYLLDNDAAVILLDVRMPNIDGFETAELIRGRERSQNVPIIFLTAYNDAGPAHLTRGYSLGAVDYIIKPIDTEILRSKVAVFVELFRKTEQVKQQADLLREKNIELENANLQRLSKLIDLGQQLAAERDPAQLLQKYCHGARDIIGASYAAVGMLEEDGQTLRYFLTNSFDHGTAIEDGFPQASSDYLKAQFKDNRSLRLSRREVGAHPLRLLAHSSPTTSFLSAPILAQGQVCGWLSFANKLGAEEFSEADERMAVTLTQAVVFYENALLYAETQRHALALEQEIAERKLIEEERAHLLIREQNARAEAEAANRLKDEFLATVSHELRTPLNAMLGWVTLVRGSQLDAEGVARGLEVIERSARSQKRLIDDLLDVSRIITGKLRLDIQMIELVPIVESAIESVRPAAEAKGVQLRAVLDSRTSTLLGDGNRLQQVIWNLVSNAVKFTPAGGSVEIELKHVHNQIEIVVSDTGLGITADFLPYVFDRFRQADSSSTRKHGGLGLGLAIVRHLVELHGGTVHAASLGVGQGSTFTIKLPLTAASLQLHAPDPVSKTNEEAELADSIPRLSGVRALVVDDQADARELVGAILSQAGAEVQTADGVTEGLTVFLAWQPDILISDLSMPDGDGFSLIRQIREREGSWGKRTPAIALTAYAGAEDRIRSLAAGFQMHLPKPIEPSELIVTIASLTGKLAQAQVLGERV